jgi:mono/diheme cytochrome c family protein
LRNLVSHRRLPDRIDDNRKSGGEVTALQKHTLMLLIAAGVVLAAVWRIESASSQILTARHPMPTLALAKAPTPSAVNDGGRLAHVNGCFRCHGDQLTGRVVFNGWFGTRLVAPNLTRLARQETDAQLAAAIRYGVNHDGTSVIAMPSNQFIKSSDSDIAAIIAYLRTLPARPDATGKTRWRFDGRAMLAVGLLPSEVAIVNRSARGPLETPNSPPALGRYITQLHCSVCHGPDLSGETIESSPDLRVSIEHYSPASFARFFRTGNGQIGHGTRTMTQIIRGRFKYLTAADIHAIYVYLRANDQLRYHMDPTLGAGG